MSKDRYERKRRRRVFSNKSLALVLSSVLLVGGIAGSTIAWLTAKTNEVRNVFTTSDIGVELMETTTTYQMIPGWKISKDPKAKVTSGSEDCYLFIKVEEKGGNVTVGEQTYTFDNFLAYAIDERWEALDEVTYPGIYYMEINEAEEKNTGYVILGNGTYTDADNIPYTWGDNEVLVKPEVTKEMMAALNEDNKPVLSFTAYAVQLWRSNESDGDSAKFTPEEAWLKISPASSS